MLPYVRLRPGRDFKPMNAALYYSHRLAVGPRIRRVITHSITTAINLRRRYKLPLISPPMLHILEGLRRDGIADLPSVAPELTEKIIQRLQDKEVVYNGTYRSSLDAVEPGTSLAAYTMSAILSCPEIFQIAGDPQIIDIVGNYLGCRPTISSIGIRWSFSDPKYAKDTQNFHRDLDDWKTVKYFIYLTDVAPDSGPHTYVKGTHKVPCGLRSRLYSLEEVQSRFGEKAVCSVTGNRGRAFIADMYGIHRGDVPEQGRRLILQIQYSILPVYAFEYRPAAADLPPDADRYMYRLLVK